MNREHLGRAGWIKYGLLLALILCGAAGGLYLAGAWPEITTASAEPGRPAPSFTHRFPLTERDAKDSIEAPELEADSGGRVFLTWASKTGEAERTVFFSRTIDAGQTFDSPKAIGKGGVFRSQSKGNRDGYERRATPHLAAVGKDLHLTWSAAGVDGAQIRLLLATSTDAGMTFGLPQAIHKAHDANPTFTALGVGSSAELACAWLGGPASQQPFAAIRRAGASAFEEERLVHAGQDGKGVCPCCALAACFAPDGTVYVAFRNMADGYRDIAVSVLKPCHMNFQGPFPVVPPTWKFNGCPHDGPSLAILGERIHVVWMDGRSGSPRCYHAQAKLGDLAFTSQELHAIPRGSQGNAKLHADAAGKLHAVWEESASAPPSGKVDIKHEHRSNVGTGGREIQYAVLGSDGRFGPAQTVAPRTGAFQTRPAITVTTGGRVTIAWNELDESGKAIVVRTFDPGVQR